ncbi:MAG: hypothetical protein M1822_006439 [Bathelium mastoideum]|nr:MAG: hypothetical protein M1822_006439 [Bathelium mastoideum]
MPPRLKDAESVASHLYPSSSTPTELLVLSCSPCSSYLCFNIESSSCIHYVYDHHINDTKDILALPQLDGEGHEHRHIPGFPPQYRHSLRVNPFVRRDALGRPFFMHDISLSSSDGQNEQNSSEIPAKRDDLGGKEPVASNETSSVQAKPGDNLGRASEDSHNEPSSGYATPLHSSGADEHPFAPAPDIPPWDRRNSGSLHVPSCPDCIGRNFGLPGIREHIHLRHVGNAFSPKRSAPQIKEDFNLRHVVLSTPTTPGPSHIDQVVQLRQTDQPAPTSPQLPPMDQVRLRKIGTPIPSTPATYKDESAASPQSLEPTAALIEKAQAEGTIHLPNLNESGAKREGAPSTPDRSKLRRVSALPPPPERQNSPSIKLQAPVQRVSKSVEHFERFSVNAQTPSAAGAQDRLGRQVEGTGIGSRRTSQLQSFSRGQALWSLKRRKPDDARPVAASTEPRPQVIALEPVQAEQTMPEQIVAQSTSPAPVNPQPNATESNFVGPSSLATNEPKISGSTPRPEETVVPESTFQEPTNTKSIAAESAVLEPTSSVSTKQEAAVTSPIFEEPPVPELTAPEIPNQAVPNPESPNPELPNLESRIPGSTTPKPLAPVALATVLTNSDASASESIITEPAATNVTAPEPLMPQNTSLKPVSPEPSILGSFFPVPTIPESTIPASTIPESTIPASTIPEPSIPESSIPESSIPESSIPEPSIPVPTIPESTIPEPAVPESTNSQSAVPAPSVPEPAVPESTISQSAIPAPLAPKSKAPLQVTSRSERPVKISNYPTDNLESSLTEKAGAAGETKEPGRLPPAQTTPSKGEVPGFTQKPTTRSKPTLPVLAGSFLTVPHVSNAKRVDGQEDAYTSSDSSTSPKRSPRYHPGRFTEDEPANMNKSIWEQVPGRGGHRRKEASSTAMSDISSLEITSSASQHPSSESSAEASSPRPQNRVEQEHTQIVRNGNDSANLASPSMALNLAQPGTIEAEPPTSADSPHSSNGSSIELYGTPIRESINETDLLEDAYVSSMLHPDERDNPHPLDRSSSQQARATSAVQSAPLVSNRTLRNYSQHFLEENIHSLPDMLDFIDSAAVDMGLDLHGDGQFDGSRGESPTSQRRMGITDAQTGAHGSRHDLSIASYSSSKHTGEDRDEGRGKRDEKEERKGDTAWWTSGDTMRSSQDPRIEMAARSGRAVGRKVRQEPMMHSSESPGPWPVDVRPSIERKNASDGLVFERGSLGKTRTVMR